MNQQNSLEPEQESGYTFEELAAALEGKPQPETTPDSSESSQTDDPPVNADQLTDNSKPETDEPMTVKALAERLQTSPQKLYKLIQIDAGDGTTFSLGEFKDKAKELRQLEQLRARQTETQLKSETDLLQKSMALDEAVQSLGRPLTQADYQAVERKRALHNQAQTALLAQIVPEFADPAERDKGFQVITGTLKDYAFSDAQIPFITDARLRKMAYDLGKLRQQLASVADAEVKPKVNQKPKPVTAIPKSTLSKVQSGKLTRAAAIDALGAKL
jgi:hypothetical protein